MEAYKIPFPGLMKEMLDWAGNETKRQKVFRVFGLCVKNRKLDLAEKIAAKYYRFFKDDYIGAMRLSLLFSKKQP